MKRHDKKQDTPAPKPPVPDALRDFIKSVAPQKDAPLKELRERFADARNHDPALHTPIPINYPHGSIEYMVELRIREWMRRKEAEDARLRRIRQELEKNRGPHRPSGPPPKAP
ncbi:MAG: hypothetical protein GC185_04535 [Alphaproteobacteria bacterium]|nr:hypothetical protein [Alphaproteobacteria bacterium]